MSSSSEPPPTRIPLELILTIFDHSIDTPPDFDTGSARQQTLVSWSLVCRSLARRAQAALFASPVLRNPNQLDLLVRSLGDQQAGTRLAGLVRAVRIGRKEGWREEHEVIFGYSEAVEVIVGACEGLRELYIWGIKEGIQLLAIAQGKALETLMLWQTPLTRPFGSPRLRALCLPNLRRLDTYLLNDNTDRFLFNPSALPALSSISLDLDLFPADHPPALLHQLRHVSTAEHAPCGNTFPRAAVYDCWESAYAVSPPIVFGEWAPLPARMTRLRLRPDPDRGAEAHEPRFGIEHLLEHLRSGPSGLEELRVPRAWDEGGAVMRELEGWCKENRVALILEDLPPVRWGQDWWSDSAFWDLVDQEERRLQ